MAFIGNRPTVLNTPNFYEYLFNGTGAQTVFTLTNPAASVGVEVHISGVRQIPTYDYTVSGTTLTFLTAPESGTNNIYVRASYLGSINTPTNGSVTSASLDATLTTAIGKANSAVQPNVANTFTATQVADNGTAAVSTTSSYVFDGADQIREITLTNAITVTFGAPTGIVQHAMYKFLLKAGDTSARTFAWNAAYKFPSATSTLASGTTTSGAYDIITFIGGATNTLIYDGVTKDVR